MPRHRRAVAARRDAEVRDDIRRGEANARRWIGRDGAAGATAKMCIRAGSAIFAGNYSRRAPKAAGTTPRGRSLPRVAGPARDGYARRIGAAVVGFGRNRTCGGRCASPERCLRAKVRASGGDGPATTWPSRRKASRRPCSLVREEGSGRPRRRHRSGPCVKDPRRPTALATTPPVRSLPVRTGWRK